MSTIKLKLDIDDYIIGYIPAGSQEPDNETYFDSSILLANMDELTDEYGYYKYKLERSPSRIVKVENDFLAGKKEKAINQIGEMAVEIISWYNYALCSEDAQLWDSTTFNGFVTKRRNIRRWVRARKEEINNATNVDQLKSVWNTVRDKYLQEKDRVGELI